MKYIPLVIKLTNFQCRISRLVSEQMTESVDTYLVPKKTVSVTTGGKLCSFVVIATTARKFYILKSFNILNSVPNLD